MALTLLRVLGSDVACITTGWAYQLWLLAWWFAYCAWVQACGFFHSLYFTALATILCLVLTWYWLRLTLAWTGYLSLRCGRGCRAAWRSCVSRVWNSTDPISGFMPPSFDEGKVIRPEATTDGRVNPESMTRGAMFIPGGSLPSCMVKTASRNMGTLFHVGFGSHVKVPWYKEKTALLFTYHELKIHLQGGLFLYRGVESAVEVCELKVLFACPVLDIALVAVPAKVWSLVGATACEMRELGHGTIATLYTQPSTGVVKRFFGLLTQKGMSMYEHPFSTGPGDSGSPLFDAQGHIVAVHVAGGAEDQEDAKGKFSRHNYCSSLGLLLARPAVPKTSAPGTPEYWKEPTPRGATREDHYAYREQKYYERLERQEEERNQELLALEWEERQDRVVGYANVVGAVMDGERKKMVNLIEDFEGSGRDVVMLQVAHQNYLKLEAALEQISDWEAKVRQGGGSFWYEEEGDDGRSEGLSYLRVKSTKTRTPTKAAKPESAELVTDLKVPSRSAPAPQSPSWSLYSVSAVAQLNAGSPPELNSSLSAKQSAGPTEAARLYSPSPLSGTVSSAPISTQAESVSTSGLSEAPQPSSSPLSTKPESIEKPTGTPSVLTSPNLLIGPAPESVIPSPREKKEKKPERSSSPSSLSSGLTKAEFESLKEGKTPAQREAMNLVFRAVKSVSASSKPSSTPPSSTEKPRKGNSGPPKEKSSGSGSKK